MKANILLATVLCAGSGLSWGTTTQNDFDRTISAMGAQAPATGYFSANEGWTQPCLGGIMYIDLTTPAGRAMWAEILTNKKTGGSVHWINYTIDANNICNATLIELR